MKKTILISALTFVAILLFSCNNTKNVNTVATTVNFNEIKSGNNSDYTKFETIKIHNFEELSVVWGRFFARYERKPAIPKIDYENKMLIAVALGERNSGGFTISIQSVIETKKEITITVEETKAGKSCATTTMMVFPFQLIEIPKTDKEIIFTKTLKINECGK